MLLLLSLIAVAIRPDLQEVEPAGSMHTWSRRRQWTLDVRIQYVMVYAAALPSLVRWLLWDRFRGG